MCDPALFNHHGHNRIAVSLTSLFVHSYNLIYPDVTHEITGDENKIVGDDAVSVDVTEGVSRCERLFGSDNWDNLET